MFFHQVDVKFTIFIDFSVLLRFDNFSWRSFISFFYSRMNRWGFWLLTLFCIDFNFNVRLLLTNELMLMLRTKTRTTLLSLENRSH